jgi:hypothetical protein
VASVAALMVGRPSVFPVDSRSTSVTGQARDRSDGGSLGPKPASRAATVTPSYVNAGSRCNVLREPRATKWVNCPIGPTLLWDGRYRLLPPTRVGPYRGRDPDGNVRLLLRRDNPQDTCHPAGLMEIHRGS